VGEEGFGDLDALPLAASGLGEPLATAAGVLGLMAGWRALYATGSAVEYARCVTVLGMSWHCSTQHLDYAMMGRRLRSIILG
jgi:hypothetical protein